ncbi:alpha/beta fold hydrolase [Algoriphagus chordae]|uniref:Alpha/beta hydrolase family protein n=1 Tax=Algoriphagus chordae TaxID=237019 RepID=A0A2W7R784_9BACT|nr:alpha/beta fold hydrolase [Algoriphagus chordae]PZX56693.1 alpha/beta hydrolase family protein [Algoriphagus chordae]
MRLALLFLFMSASLQAQSILVPYDHHLPNSREIEIQVEFLNEFDAGKETVFLLEDAFDVLFVPFYEMLEITESSNIVLIKGRKDNEELRSGVMHSGVPDYRLAYKLYNQDQVARDIELIRKKLIGDEQAILLGYSSSATVLQHYLTLFPEHVSRIISVNPLVFDIQKNLSFPPYDLFFQELKLNQEQVVDFSYYANYDRESVRMKSRSMHNLLEFMKYQDFLTGFSARENIEENFGLAVRLFEHSLALMGLQDASPKTNPSLDLMKKWSQPIWDAYLKTNFPIYGTNYDRMLEFQGRMVLIGAAFDQMIYPKSYDILAEFYANCTLLLLKDGHALQQVMGDAAIDELLAAFISNDLAQKVAAYKKLSDSNLIFEKYNEGDYKIPPLF